MTSITYVLHERGCEFAGEFFFVGFTTQKLAKALVSHKAALCVVTPQKFTGTCVNVVLIALLFDHTKVLKAGLNAKDWALRYWLVGRLRTIGSGI